MSKKYTKQGQRASNSQRPRLNSEVDLDSTHMQLTLPIAELLAHAREGIESLLGEIGVLVLNGLIEDEVDQVVGPRGKRQTDRQAYRWGRERGYVVFAGQKIPLEKARVRSVDGKEVPLARYALFQDEDRLEESVANQVLRRVSTRDYEGAVGQICDGYGVKKSSVSRHWKAASAKELARLLQRPLEDLDVFGVMIDGIHFHDYTLIVALGFTSDGKKQVLGLWLGATENATLCTALLTDLRDRGLPTDRRTLFVLDGSKALYKGVVDVFGKCAVIQRCQQHKKENVVSYVPKDCQAIVRKRLEVAWGLTKYSVAKKSLLQVVDYLEDISYSAANSLREGLEETLTLHRLQASAQLRKSFSTTNPIENCFSRSRDLCRNVKHWKNADMAQRWAGTVLLKAESKFHRVKGYRDLPMLITALRREVVDSASVVA